MAIQTAVPHLSPTPASGFLSPPKAEPAWTTASEPAQVEPPAVGVGAQHANATATTAATARAVGQAVACTILTPSGSKAADAAGLVRRSLTASDFEIELTSVEPRGVLEAMFRSGLSVILRMPDQALLPMTISAVTGPPTGRRFYLLPTE